MFLNSIFSRRLRSKSNSLDRDWETYKYLKKYNLFNSNDYTHRQIEKTAKGAIPISMRSDYSGDTASEMQAIGETIGTGLDASWKAIRDYMKW